MPKEPKHAQKYLDACLCGDIDSVTHMILKEDKTYKSGELLDQYFVNACEGGNLDIVKKIYKYANDRNHSVISNIYTIHTIYYATKGGNTDIIKFIVDNIHPLDKQKDCTLWIFGLFGACETSRFDLFNEYMDKLTSDNIPHECLTHACMSDSNLEMVKHLIKNGITYYNSAFISACTHGCIKIVEFLIELSSSYQWSDGLVCACSCGSIPIIELMFKNGTCNLSNCLYVACKGGYMEVVQLLVQKGSNDWSSGLDGACIGGYLEIAVLMVQSGAVNFVYCLYGACCSGNLDLVKFLTTCISINNHMDWGLGLRDACMGNYIKIVQYMLDNNPTDPSGYIDSEILNEALKVTRKSNTDIINLLIMKGSRNSINFSLLRKTEDFKLYRMYLKHTSAPHKYDHNDTKYLMCLYEYPPYVLFVGCRLTMINTNCHVRRLPVELFRLLDGY